MTRPESPNTSLDEAIKGMMAKLKPKKGQEELPPDIAVKILNTAIAWEKAKAQIVDKSTPFDPDTFDQ